LQFSLQAASPETFGYTLVRKGLEEGRHGLFENKLGVYFLYKFVLCQVAATGQWVTPAVGQGLRDSNDFELLSKCQA